MLILSRIEQSFVALNVEQDEVEFTKARFFGILRCAGFNKCKHACSWISELLSELKGYSFFSGESKLQLGNPEVELIFEKGAFA